MSRVMQHPVSGKFNGWLKEKLRNPNMYCALGGVAVLAFIELVLFAS